MDPDPKTRPEYGASERRGGPSEAEGQPSRDAVFGLRRLVIETRDRLGPSATPDAIVRDLRSQGISVTAEEVARCCAEPY
jgi:hypothetical protein